MNIFKKSGKVIKESTISQPIMAVDSSKNIITTFFKEFLYTAKELYKILKKKKQKH